MNQWAVWLVVGLIWAGLFPYALEYVLSLWKSWAGGDGGSAG